MYTLSLSLSVYIRIYNIHMCCRYVKYIIYYMYM